MNTHNIRLILFHKHPVSAKLHFVRFAYGGVCGFEPLPKLSALIESNCESTNESKTPESVIHPNTILRWAEQHLQLQSDTLQAELEYCEQVEVPNETITVYLAGFSGYEMPDATLSRYDARFVTLMECIGIAPVDMLLLQKAYRVIMGA